jgi:hypothetical protein
VVQSSLAFALLLLLGSCCWGVVAVRARCAFDGLVVRLRLRLVVARYLCWALVWVDHDTPRVAFYFLDCEFTPHLRGLYGIAPNNKHVNVRMQQCFQRRDVVCACWFRQYRLSSVWHRGSVDGNVFAFLCTSLSKAVSFETHVSYDQRMCLSFVIPRACAEVLFVVTSGRDSVP